MLMELVPLLTLPTYSSITFGLLPTDLIIDGELIFFILLYLVENSKNYNFEWR